MILTILGSGSATPTISRNPTAQLLEASGRFFLIDCGEGTQHSLLRQKVSTLKIDHIFISHLHGDHWLGLPGLVSSMHLGGRTNPLHIYCHSGLEDILKTIFKYSQTELRFEIVYHIHKDSGINQVYENSSLYVFIFPLKHRILCNGFLFQEKPRLRNISRDALEIHRIPAEELQAVKEGADWKSPKGAVIPNKLLTKDPKPSLSYAFCSDTVFDPEIVAYINGVDLLYHEATFLEDMKPRAVQTFHTTASEAGKIARMAEVKMLLIGHFSSRYKQIDYFLEEAKAEFSNTVLAFDGMKLEI